MTLKHDCLANDRCWINSKNYYWDDSTECFCYWVGSYEYNLIISWLLEAVFQSFLNDMISCWMLFLSPWFPKTISLINLLFCFLIKKILNWSMVDLQWCVGLGCTVGWFRYMYIHIHTYILINLNLPDWTGWKTTNQRLQ